MTVTPSEKIQSEFSDDETLNIEYSSDSVGEYQHKHANSDTSSNSDDETFL